uniref:Ig-like domain-containing protein n=1 Tax=Echeneis naucrates TaxID=173247 RepID=A0A665WVX6_ECHNA
MMAWAQHLSAFCVLVTHFFTVRPQTNEVTVTLQPDWSVIYRGEKVTVRCQIQGGDTQWTYEWSTTSSNKPPSDSEYIINRATESDTGDYSCRGRKVHSATRWSQAKRLTVSGKFGSLIHSDNVSTDFK